MIAENICNTIQWFCISVGIIRTTYSTCISERSNGPKSHGKMLKICHGLAKISMEPIYLLNRKGNFCLVVVHASFSSCSFFYFSKNQQTNHNKWTWTISRTIFHLWIFTINNEKKTPFLSQAKTSSICWSGRPTPPDGFGSLFIG